MAEGYKWRPLPDLPDDPHVLTDSELDPLLQVWVEQRSMLEKQGTLEIFSTRLKREWAIETGAIEGVYTLERGITQTLIERGINASFIKADGNDKTPEQIARIIEDHADVLEGLFAFVKGERELSVGYIKELHAALLRSVDTYTAVSPSGEVFHARLDKGKYKTLPNNPSRPDGSVHEYCPPEHVASEMDRMVALHQEHLRKNVPVEVSAAWLHHVFTQIHPFQDGNGRVARAIASLVFMKAGWFPLVVSSHDDRVRYLDALETADRDDLRRLVSLFSTIQKKTLVRASHVVYEVKPPQNAEEAIAAARDILIASGQIGPKEWMQAKTVAATLYKAAQVRLLAVTTQLREEIGSVREDFQFVLTHGDKNGGQPLLPDELAQSTAALGYVPNLYDCNDWSFLQMKTVSTSDVFFSIHSIGPNFHGLLSALLLFRREGKTVVVGDDFFQINYQEEPEAAQSRFRAWFEKQITAALTLWRRTL